MYIYSLLIMIKKYIVYINSILLILLHLMTNYFPITSHNIVKIVQEIKQSVWCL